MTEFPVQNTNFQHENATYLSTRQDHCHPKPSRIHILCRCPPTTHMVPSVRHVLTPSRNDNPSKSACNMCMFVAWLRAVATEQQRGIKWRDVVFRGKRQTDSGGNVTHSKDAREPESVPLSRSHIPGVK